MRGSMRGVEQLGGDGRMHEYTWASQHTDTWICAGRWAYSRVHPTEAWPIPVVQFIASGCTTGTSLLGIAEQS